MEVIVTTPVWTLNGVNVFSANLVRGLVAEGISARLLISGVTYRDRKPMVLPGDIPVEHLRIPIGATWSARRKRLTAYLESHGPCIYLPNHDFLHSSISAALSPAVGVVGIVHSDDHQHYEHARRMSRSWQATVAVSNTIADYVSADARIDSSRLSVIPYGVEVPSAVPVRGVRSKLRIIYAGRLEQKQKRSGDLIAIASSLLSRKVEFEMTIAGDGPARPHMEKTVAGSALAHRVRFVGNVANDEMLKMYRDFDAFVLPSSFEGMPIALLESMAQGCVPFATRIASGIPEIIESGRNGYTFHVGDTEDFAAALERFSSSHSDRERLSTAAWQTTLDSYRTDRMVKSYIDVFDRVSAQMTSGKFVRPSFESNPPVSLRDRIAAPLWALRPGIRGQQNPRR